MAQRKSRASSLLEQQALHDLLLIESDTVHLEERDVTASRQLQALNMRSKEL